MSNLGHISEYDADCLKFEQQNDKPVIRLDLACGNNKKEGYLGVDVSKDTQADIIVDLERYPWVIEMKKDKNGNWVTKDDLQDTELSFFVSAFAENSVYEIHACHYIEHVSDLKAFMEEIYRIMIPGGRVIFYAPYYSSMRSIQDYTHKRFISESTFLYFDKKWLEYNGLGHYSIDCNFATLSTKFLFAKKWNTKSDDAKEWARQHFINVVEDIEIVLQTIKEKGEIKNV